MSWLNIRFSSVTVQHFPLTMKYFPQYMISSILNKRFRNCCRDPDVIRPLLYKTVNYVESIRNQCFWTVDLCQIGTTFYNGAGTSRRIRHSYCYMGNVYYDGWSLNFLLGREKPSLLRKATLHIIDCRRFRNIMKSDY